MSLAPGTEFAGHRIESIAGRGGMGVVYKATHLALDITVALKVITPDLIQDETFRERFKRESRVAASIEHPHLVPVRDAGEEDGVLYVTMRFVDGTDLGRLIRGGALSPDLAVELIAQIGDGLDAAHRHGLVHRDVKPANILVDDVDDRAHAYLTDFGIARSQSGTDRLTMTGSSLGTLAYMAPEQFTGNNIDGRVDVYALGCVLYQALTGEVPFRRDTEVGTMYAHLNDPVPAPSESISDLPAEMDDVVAKAMAKDRDDRFATAAELGRAARAALRGEAVATPTTKLAAPGPDDVETEVSPGGADTDLAATESATAAPGETALAGTAAGSTEAASAPPAAPKPGAPKPPAPPPPPARPAAAPRGPAPPARPRRGRLVAGLVAAGVVAAVVAAIALGGGGDGGESPADDRGGNVPSGDGDDGGNGSQGDGSDTSGQEALAAFREDADTICLGIERDVDTAAENAGAPEFPSPEARAEFQHERAGIVRKGVDRLGGLEVPQQLRAMFNEYVATRSGFADTLDEFGDAISDRDQAAIEAASKKLDSLVTEKISLGTRLGLVECSDTLPNRERADATEVAIRYLRGQFGASNVRMTDVTGVATVHAEVYLTADGEAVLVKLDWDGDRWVVESVGLLSE